MRFFLFYCNCGQCFNAITTCFPLQLEQHLCEANQADVRACNNFSSLSDMKKQVQSISEDEHDKCGSIDVENEVWTCFAEFYIRYFYYICVLMDSALPSSFWRFMAMKILIQKL